MIYVVEFAQGGDNRTVSTSESVASTLTAPSGEDMTTEEEDNVEDNGDTSDTASAPSPGLRPDIIDGEPTVANLLDDILSPYEDLFLTIFN